MTPQDCKIALQEANCCVLIPSYNNQKTVGTVIQKVLEYTDNLIVVNDGATDDTPAIIESFSDKITIIHHDINQGKGMALRNGFKKALELGFDHVLTLDSDGQHYPEDIPNFIQANLEFPGSLFVGARNMEQEGVPKKSSFGHKFSNFWFRLETGTNLPDTQSGFRWYPVSKMPKRYFTRKFEFEIEVIVRTAWKNIPVRPVTCQVLYNDERITHFRPFQDFARISVLNTILVIFSFLQRPKLAILNLSLSKIFRFLKEQFIVPNESTAVKAFSIGFGFFMGIIPLWGLQLLIGIPTAHFLKLNKAIFITAAHISVAPLIPLIVYFSFHTGALLLNEPVAMRFSWDISVSEAQTGISQYLLGSITLATLMGLLGTIISYVMISLYRTLRKQNG